MNKITLRAAAARQRFTDLRKAGIRRSLAEKGAIDLFSIMVGVIVIGVIAGGIAATVFGVIPWSQDKAAEQALGAVSTAESVQAGFSSEKGTTEFADKATLVGTTNASGTSLLQDSDKIYIALGAQNKTYTAYSLSATTNVFKVDSAQPTTVSKATGAELTAAKLSVVAGKLVYTP